ncbi:hypothetical protein Pyn_10382 [Prunus yedoensis var. nudiflora]|uniref:Uncharacterized protein n=1 Tax=Prunus yedoensis var. nudiflora TaxID=2094558 RepID=A0A314XKM3_PRUYE|nr:hypothetical protein Pyn_10382 [Prunus yedoensis var. nudiflora]
MKQVADVADSTAMSNSVKALHAPVGPEKAKAHTCTRVGVSLVPRPIDSLEPPESGNQTNHERLERPQQTSVVPSQRLGSLPGPANGGYVFGVARACLTQFDVSLSALVIATQCQRGAVDPGLVV